MKTMPSNRACNAQRGQTLISLMVGMLISVMVAASMLALYQALITVSNESIQASQRDGQTATAMLALQMEVQQAGFGIDPAEGADAVIWVAADGKEVRWRYRESLEVTARLCAGVQIREAQGTRGTLSFLQPQACVGTPLSAVTWGASDSRPLASVTAFTPSTEGSLGIAGADGLAGARFDITACSSPFLAIQPESSDDIVASAGRQITLSDAQGVTLMTVCNLNLPQT